MSPQSAAQASNLRAFWGCLLGAFGVPLDLLGDPWGSFAISLGRLGSSWPTLGRLLATLWAHFADPCPLLATIWCTLASFLMPLGSHMGLKGHLCALLGNLRCFFDIFFVRVSHSPKCFVAFSVLFSLRSSCSVSLIVVFGLSLCNYPVQLKAPPATTRAPTFLLRRILRSG